MQFKAALMRKKSLVLWLPVLFSGAVFAQIEKGQINVSKVPAPQWHYQPEYAFDISVDQVKWSKLEPGLHVAFGSTDELYLRSEVPVLDQEEVVWNGTAIFTCDFKHLPEIARGSGRLGQL